MCDEYPIGQGKTIDLVVSRGEERMAIEVETGRSDVAGNIDKCLEAGFERVVVAAVTPAVKRRLKREWARKDRKVRVMVVGELLNSLGAPFDEW